MLRSPFSANLSASECSTSEQCFLQQRLSTKGWLYIVSRAMRLLIYPILALQSYSKLYKILIHWGHRNRAYLLISFVNVNINVSPQSVLISFYTRLLCLVPYSDPVSALLSIVIGCQLLSESIPVCKPAILLSSYDTSLSTSIRKSSLTT